MLNILINILVKGAMFIIGLVLGIIITCWCDSQFIKYTTQKILGKKCRIRKGVKVKSLDDIETLHSTVKRLKELNKMIVTLKSENEMVIKSANYYYYSLMPEEQKVVIEALEIYISQVEQAASKYIELK